MTLVLLVAALAVAGAVAAGGGPGLAALPVRALRLLVAAAVGQVAVAVLAPDSGWARAVALVLSTLLVGLFLAGNRRLPGVPLVVLGLLLNVAVVALNGAMPVSQEAALRAGVPAESLVVDGQPVRELLGPDTRLGALGDRIPVASPWRPQAVSVGDVLVAAGVGLLLVSAARRPRPRPRRPAARPARRGQPRGQTPRRDERSTVLASESTTRGSYS